MQEQPRTSLSTNTPSPHYKYLVRIINPEQRSKHVTKIWHDVYERFYCADQLKTKLINDFEEKLPQLSDLVCGYLDKSAKRWIEDDQDVEAMYHDVSSGSEITIWCDGRLPEQQSSEPPRRKRKAPENSDPPPPTKRADKIDQLALELHEKHGDQYSMPHLRIWARMILNKQHKSMDVAPPFPLFKDHAPKNTPKRDNLTDALTSAATAVVGLLKGGEPSDSVSSLALSPGKRARVSGQYLEHLEKLKSLHQSGVLTTEEFNEQKKFALNNIRKLND